MFLDQYCVMHAMDAASRYSVGAVVEDTSMWRAILVFDAHWVTPFWTPQAVAFDRGFNNSVFMEYLQTQDIGTRPLPPRRHSKNVLESKHRIIRDVFLRKQEASKNDKHEWTDKMLVQQAIRISNDLYGSQILSAQELAKGYARPVQAGSLPKLLSQDLIDAYQQLLAKRKLTLILRSKTLEEASVAVGDMVQVFVKNHHDKRGKWSENRPVLAYDVANRTVTVPGSKGRQVNAAMEDDRPAICDNELAAAVQDAIDELDRNLEEVVQDLDNDTQSEEDNSAAAQNQATHESDEELDCIGPNLPKVGEKIEVYWPIDKKFYEGTVHQHDEKSGKFSVNYDDGDKEKFTLENEVWNYVKEAPTEAQTEPGTQDADRMQAGEVQLSPGQELESSEKNLIETYYKAFGHGEFMLHEAQGLPPYASQNAYDKEERSFEKIVRDVAVSQVPKTANIVTSHVFYKVKRCNDNSLTLKARIAVHGNKDRDKDILKTDSATCPPVGIRILLSLTTIFSWTLAKIDFKSAFLQTEAQRDVYLVPPRECKNRHQHYWLLLSAAYGLANAGAKWQQFSDDVLRSFGFHQLVYVPQLFYKKSNGKIIVVAVKVVDDILFGGERSTLAVVIEQIGKCNKLGTIVYGPGKIHFYGLVVTQFHDMTTAIDGEDKMQGYKASQISRVRRREQDSRLNSIELAAFRSLNSSIGWLGVAASPFCAHAASYLQQKGPKPLVKDLITQINLLKSLKKKGTTLKFVRPIEDKAYQVSVVVFSDASRSEDYGQLGYIAGLLFGKLELNSIIHVVAWSSHKSRRPVKSIGSAETLAAGEAIDEGKVLSRAFSTLLGIQVGLWIVVDSKDLYSTLSTCRNATDRSIRGDISLIRYEFETRRINRMVWIPGKINYADPMTKCDSPICESLELMLFDGKISVDFGNAMFNSSNKSTG